MLSMIEALLEPDRYYEASSFKSKAHLAIERRLMIDQ
jgi:hypothetical protein